MYLICVDRALFGWKGLKILTMKNDGISVLPVDIIESLEAINVNCEEVEPNLREVLALCDTDVLAELSPIDHACKFLILAKEVATLLTLQLRCSEESPNENNVKTELVNVLACNEE